MKNVYALGLAGLIISTLILAAFFQKKSSSPTTQLPQSSLESSTTPPLLHPAASATMVHSVGEVTRHAQQFIHTEVRIRGYLLMREAGYVIFSDEASGVISKFDLPVIGNGIDTVKPNHLYLLDGVFEDTGLISSNKNPNDLKLTVPPTLLK